MATDESPPDGTLGDSTEPIAVEGDDHFERLLDSTDLVLADFFADWCAPCVVVGDFVETAAERTPATVAKVDVEAHQRLADRFNVRSLPTLVLFQDGTAVERLVGLQDEADIVRLVERFVE